MTSLALRLKNRWIVVFAILLLSVGSGMWWTNRGTPEVVQSAASSAAASPQFAPATHSQATTSQTPTSKSNARLTEVNANLTLKVSHVLRTLHTITQMVSLQHGYVTQTQLSSMPHSSDQVRMTFRIPQTIVSPFIMHLESLGHTVTFSQSGVDVTRQYNDLTLQTATLTDEVRAYQQLFKKATSMKSMLQIQQALTQVQAQLQTANQQKAILTHNVQFASVQLTLVPQPILSGARAHPGFLNAASSSLQAMRYVAFGFVVVLGWIAPWIFVFLVIGITARYLLRIWTARHITKV